MLRKASASRAGFFSTPLMVFIAASVLCRKAPKRAPPALQHAAQDLALGLHLNPQILQFALLLHACGDVGDPHHPRRGSGSTALNSKE